MSQPDKRAARDTGWIKDWPMQRKIGVGFGLVALLLLINASAFFLTQNQQDEAREWATHTYSVLMRLQNLQIAALDQQAGLRGYAITASPDELRTYQAGINAFEKSYAELLDLTADNAVQQARLVKVGDTIKQWQREVAEPIREQVTKTGHDDQAGAQILNGGRLFDNLRDQIGEARGAELMLLGKRNTRLAVIVENTRFVTLVLLAIGLLISLYAVRRMQSLVTRPIVEMTQLMTRLASQDATIEVPRVQRRDEIGAIARALQSFKLMTVEMQSQAWVKGTAAGIAENLQRAGSEQAFADVLSTGLATPLGCGLAVFYAPRSERPEELAAIGGCGIGPSPAALPRFLIGEGLVGQCAEQRLTLEFERLPESYLRIRSGLGDAAPQRVLLVPLVLQQRLLGVLELASFGAFTLAHRRLVDELMPVAALSLENLLRARRTQMLLEETQVQSEELQSSEEALRVQQEELRATNDALHARTAQLEQQASQLKASEEELKLQTEELKITNDQLVEKGATLQEQKMILEGLQRETQEKADELARASQYKSDFLANMSHELRTPLNSLLILSRSLADNDEGHLDTDEVESAEVIHDSGKKLLQLINDILDLSKVEAGKMELLHGELPLSDFVNSLRRNFRHVAEGRKLSFDIVVEPGLPAELHTDAARLEQILNNLLGNAFKFTKAGSVTLHIGRPAEESELPPGLVREGTIAMAVTDTGIGIPPDKLHRMFQAFEQVDAGTSRQYGGTGLGLSIARGMARLLGGDIVMSSEAGVGSTFTVLLPEQPPETQAEREPSPLLRGALAFAGSAAANDSDRNAGATPALPRMPVIPPAMAPSIPDDRELLKPGDTVILIIEDDPAFARILAELIRRKGYRVLAAGDGETGLALAQQYLPSGVLLDIMLPGMDGWAVIDRMKADARLQPIPVHFISANGDSERAIEAGAIGFLAKPVTKSALLQAFDRLLQQPQPGGTRRVLLVDDDADSRHAMRKLLDEAGVELVDAGSGEEALSLMETTRFDCIVLDLGLPGMSGYEFLERSSQLSPLPPVVIHSGRELSRDESLRLRQYTDSIVIKGARSPERLLDEVSLFLHSIRPAAPVAPRELDSGLNGRTVLVVDDDMRNIFALSKTLRARGLKVLMAQDGHKALKQLVDNADVDLVLMDIMMPGMDGYETMREVRKQPMMRVWVR